MSGGDAQRGARSAAAAVDLTRGLLSRTANLLGPGSRLPSLRTPRDLTLGGAAKRTFTPTIPTRREKGKEQPVVADASGQSDTSEKRGRGRGRGRGGRGRGRGRGNDLIQLQSSVFADGPAERMMRARGRAATVGGDYGGKSVDNYVNKPKVSFDFSATSVDPEEEKKRLQEIYKDDFIDDGDDDEEICEKERPVILPLRPVAVKPEIRSPVKVKKEIIKSDENMDTSSTVEQKIKVKSEPLSGDEMESLDAIKDFIASTSSEVKVKQKDEKKVVQPPMSPMSCKDVFSKAKISDSEEIFLVQLPEILPGLPKSKDERKPKIKQEPGTGFGSAEPSTSAQAQNDAKEKSAKEKGTSLSEVSEGYIGKIQILKSGKTRLLLGNATFDVELSTQVGFLQDLVSLRIDEKEPNGGSLSTLGHVKHKIICVPDMDAMSSGAK